MRPLPLLPGLPMRAQIMPHSLIIYTPPAPLIAAIFKCTKGLEAEADEVEKPKPAPWAGCEALEGANCTANPACSLCSLASGVSLCFDSTIAKFLPECE